MRKIEVEGHRRYTVDEVAAIKGVDVRTVMRWIEHGLLPALELGSEHLVRGSDLFLVGKVRAHEQPEIAIVLSKSQLNTPGNDNEQLNQQYVCLRNVGLEARNLTNWHLQDAKGATFDFPSFELPAGGDVLVHTGSGQDTLTDLYWGRGSSVWCNEGDTVRLFDRLWGIVDEKEYVPDAE